MIITVLGGGSSGKSALAEDIALKLGGRKAYVATAFPTDDEMASRIEMHKAQRSGKNFVTLEKPLSFKFTDVVGYDTVMLECMSTWVANEIYSKPYGDINNIYRFIENIKKSSINFVIVTNDIYGLGINYSKETVEYMQILGKIGVLLGKASDIFLKILYKVPICLKGKEIYEERF